MNKDILRRLQLFADLPEADLDWLSTQAEPVSLAAGEVLIEQGTPGDAAYIILEGALEVNQKSDMHDIRIAMRAVGEVIGEMALLDQSVRTATVRTVLPSRLLKIDGDTFRQLISQNPSAALVILHTVSMRLRQNEALLRQSEKMAALGTLAAGLAHELNNPTAAIRRGVDQLRSTLDDWARTFIELDHCTLNPKQIHVIHDLQGSIANYHPLDQVLDPLIQSDRETEIQVWLEEIGLEQAWEFAPILVSSSWELDRLRNLASTFDPESLIPVVKWLALSCAVYSLLDETHIGATRISEIVKSVKAYSYLDQGPIQVVDVHAGLENTLVILRHKTKEAIQIKREYAHDLPPIEVYGSELNQVWTNIIDNAIDAMDGKGELTLRTFSKDGNVVVEIEDTGQGIPADIQSRIFEPFFTTKPPGMGTGLGLHIAYTIVNNHHGQIQVFSQPGTTRFQVSLPMQLPR